MTYIWYKTANNIISYLVSSISPTSTSMIVNDWNIFPSSFPYLLTLEQQSNWQTVKREIVKVTAKNWSTLTIERAVEWCVSDDTESPKTYSQVARSFEANTVVSLSMTAGTLQDINTWIAEDAQAISDANQQVTDLINLIQTLENDISNL